MAGMITGFNLRLKNNIFRRIRYIAFKNRRSINMQITVIIEQYLKDYEKVNGKIEEKDIIESELEQNIKADD